MIPIEGRLERELLEIVKARTPEEAVGVIYPDGTIVTMENMSATPNNAFEVHKSQLVLALEECEDVYNAIFWHSHPSGGVGPSRIDLQQKTPLTYHLVVSLKEGALVPTWY